VLALGHCVGALVLGVTLYVFTRRSQLELSTLLLACRTGEAVLFGVYALGIVAAVPSPSPYSWRSASVGGMRAARRAGT
jgi:hypothetical protein